MVIEFRWRRHRVGWWSAHDYEIKRSSRRGRWRILRGGTLWDACSKLTDAKAACVRDFMRRQTTLRRPVAVE